MSESNGISPDVERELARRRRRGEFIWTILIILGILTLFVIERYALPTQGNFPISHNIMFFGLINLNLILICILLFLILRNLAKLFFERRRKTLGAGLRTKLIVAFSGFALLPTIIMFYAAMTFVTRSIDNWFSVQIEQSLKETLEVAQSYYLIYRKNSTHIALNLADSLSHATLPASNEISAVQKDADADQGKASGKKSTFSKESILKSLHSESTNEILAAKQREHNFDALEVVWLDNVKTIFSTGGKYAGTTRDDAGRKFLSSVADNKFNSEIMLTEHGEIVRGAAPVFAGTEAVAAVVVSYLVPNSVLKRMSSIRKTYDDYRQLMLFKRPALISYLVIFALISIFIFFAATWFGFFLARGIAVPIQKMADATERVAAGDLNARIEWRSKDEMGRLTDSFNRMIEDLRRSRGQVEQSAQDLNDKNLELDQRRRYIETVLSNISAGVISFSADDRISTINKSARKILALDESVLGKHFTDAFQKLLTQAQAEDFAKSLRLRGGSFVEQEAEVSIRGETRTLLTRITVLSESSDERDAGAVMVLDDLTELIKAKRVAAWREIAQRIAHEIKNPLTPIQLAAQRLRKRYGDHFKEEGDSTFFESTATIIRQVGEMKSMVQEFSNFARLAEIDLRPGQINDIITETSLLYSEAHPKIDFHIEPDPEIPLLNIDRAQIKRALINILDNAVDAITGPGNIRIKTRRDAGAGEVVVQLSDDGAGLPAAYKRRLFEPYFSTKKMGTGLGLAIVHQIMADHGGRIDIKEMTPSGTMVVLCFPISTLVEAKLVEGDENDESQSGV